MNNKIKDFFDKHISPLSKHADACGSCYLDLQYGKNINSYFTEPQYPQYLYLNNISFENQIKLEQYLKEFWKDQPALLNLIPDLISLAFSLKEQHNEQSAELSPFVYTMF